MSHSQKNTKEDFVASDFFTYSVKNNEVYSGGYLLDSHFIKNHVNIPYDLNNKLKDLAVPFGLFSLNIKGNELLENVHDVEEVNNEIYQKLLNNMNPKLNKQFKNTRKRLIKSQKKTIKNNKKRS